MVVVITGASKGIGKAVAERFAAEGHTLVLCARNGEQLEAAANELAAIHPLSPAPVARHPHTHIFYRTADMSLKDEVMAFGNWVQKTVGVPGILVNNAGSYLPGDIHTEEDGVVEKMMETNLYSAYHLTRVLLPAMMQAKNGHIFNMCSIASLQAYPGGGSYSISKFALAGFSKNLREELKPFNIKVTAVYPGAVYTDSWSGSGINPERIMQSADVAELIHTVSKLSPQACVEDIVLRPQLGAL